MKALSPDDKKILVPLARQVREIAMTPEQQEKRDLWRKHTSLQGNKPLIFVSPEGSWDEFLPLSAMKCENEAAKRLERELRMRLFRYETIRDDTPIEKDFDIPLASIPMDDGWGVNLRREGGGRGSWHCIPVIEKASDWKKLKKPVLSIDERWARERCELYRDAVGEYIDFHVCGIKAVDFHVTHIYCDFRGLENFYYDLYDEPETVSEVFEFITEGLENYVRELRESHLITGNNDYTYHYTGGLGYTYDLPCIYDQEADPSEIWAAAEAQEYSSVSPEMFRETILPFEKRLLEPFGLNGYGCCDDLTEKLDEVLKIKNLRRVAACPWANLKKMADRLKKEYILTWKPNPSYLAMETFDAELVETYMRKSLADARNGYPEIILRDTHSCRNEPERFGRFVEITRKVISELYD